MKRTRSRRRFMSTWWTNDARVSSGSYSRNVRADEICACTIGSMDALYPSRCLALVYPRSLSPFVNVIKYAIHCFGCYATPKCTLHEISRLYLPSPSTRQRKLNVMRERDTIESSKFRVLIAILSKGAFGGLYRDKTWATCLRAFVQTTSSPVITVIHTARYYTPASLTFH